MVRVTSDGKNPVFLTFFPECEDIHLTKDVGMIPYILHKHFSYNAYILTNKNDEYSRLNSETPGLKLCFFPVSQNNPAYSDKEQQSATHGTHQIISCACNSLRFLSKYGKRIDILQLYHYKLESLIVASLFRFFNPKGVLYLKLDLDPDSLHSCRLNIQKLKKRVPFQSLLLRFISFDIISVETEAALNFLKTEHPLFKKFYNYIYYIPNGVDIEHPATATLLQQPPDRENVILHVGRLGTFPKGTEIALEAFVRVARIFPQWKLVLIGPMTEPFKRYFTDFLEAHKDISHQIIYKGYLSSREDLMKEYAKSKILLQPSRNESFGLVVVESGIFGTVFLGSDIGSFREITNNGAYGYLCPVDDVECFSKTLHTILSFPDLLDERSDAFKIHVQKCYNWLDICTELNNLLSSCAQKRHRI
jgi:L-malate glycosyltransferase